MLSDKVCLCFYEHIPKYHSYSMRKTDVCNIITRVHVIVYSREISVLAHLVSSRNSQPITDICMMRVFDEICF